MKRPLFIGALIGLFSGCSINSDKYSQNSPEFDFKAYFSGHLCAWGVVRERDGSMKRKFVADIEAYTQKDKVILDERFLFNDGERQTREWSFELKNKQWIGTAHDVVGQASGEVIGDSLHLTYELLVKVDDNEYQIAMNDWLHLIDQQTLMGSTKMSKWGFEVGSIDIVMQRQQNNNITCTSLEQDWNIHK